MPRTKTTTPVDAILCGDFHLRDDQPPCRKDDFQQAQWNKIQFIKDLQERYQCPVIHSGDLFHHWKPSPELLSKAIERLPDQFWSVYGNHDLPQHNVDLAYKCGMNVLQAARKIKILPETHWGHFPDPESKYHFGGKRNILVWHVMTYQGKIPYPGCTELKSSGLLRKYKTYDLIHTGHNHKTFVEEYEDQLLINVGSLSRQEAGEMDHEPCVFLYYARTNTYKKILLPFETGVVSREHIDVVNEKNAQLDSFISRLDMEWEGSTSFRQNLASILDQKGVNPETKKIVHNSLELEN